MFLLKIIDNHRGNVLFRDTTLNSKMIKKMSTFLKRLLVNNL